MSTPVDRTGPRYDRTHRLTRGHHHHRTPIGRPPVSNAVHVEVGLTADEVATRIAQGRVNRVTARTGRSPINIVRANVLTPVNGIMLALFALILLAGFWRDGLFVGVVVSNSVIGVWQEVKARRELHRLEVLNAPVARVVRNAQVAELDVSDVVADDILDLGPGDQIVVDGVVIASTGLEVDESLLTGESEPLDKISADEVRSGSFVVAGTGRYRATKVGDESYANSLAGEVKRFSLVNSELRQGINAILKVLVILIPPASLLLFLALIDVEDTWQPALQGTVAAAVAMVPDGLVLLTSLAFVAGVIALTRHKALAKELATVELLARVDVLCLDKTGTITTGDISFARSIPLDGTDPGFIDQALGALAYADPRPNSTMEAIRLAHSEPDGWAVVATEPFSSATKWSGVQFGEQGTFYLGAPDIVFSHGDDQASMTAASLAAEGQRVLLLSRSASDLTDDLAAARSPLALIVLEDTIRPDAREILRFFAEQGVALKVISGDNVNTVVSVAARAGVPNAMMSLDARELPDDVDALADVVDSITVFGRVTPHQKQAMVGALQSRDHVVAMTGDGVNDVLALKDADMGIAMGNGSAASRGVAQLVLLDNRFATLPEVLAQGRRVINNIERVANLFVTKAVYAVLLTAIIGLQRIPFPFLPRQLTLIGTFSIGLPGIVLALVANEELVKPGFLRRVLSFSLPAGVVSGLATWLVYTIAHSDRTTSLGEARTAATLTLLAIGLAVLVVVARSLRKRAVVLAAAMAGLYGLVIAVPLSRRFFELELPDTPILGLAAVASLTAAALVVTVPRIMPTLRNH